MGHQISVSESEFEMSLFLLHDRSSCVASRFLERLSSGEPQCKQNIDFSPAANHTDHGEAGAHGRWATTAGAAGRATRTVLGPWAGLSAQLMPHCYLEGRILVKVPRHPRWPHSQGGPNTTVLAPILETTWSIPTAPSSFPGCLLPKAAFLFLPTKLISSLFTST